MIRMGPWLLYLVKTFCPFPPIIEKRILVFELFPRTAGMGPVEHGKREEEIVVKPGGKTLVGDGDIEPVLRFIKPREVIGLEQGRSQERTAEGTVWGPGYALQ